MPISPDAGKSECSPTPALARPAGCFHHQPRDLPLTKQPSVTAVIRQMVIKHQDANTKDLKAKVEAAGFQNVKLSMITTIAADTKATLREAAALGLLRSAEEQVHKPTSPRPRRSRSRSRRQAAVTEAEAASA